VGEQLSELLDKKLAAPWLQKNRWIRDFAEALATAKAEEKLIFAYFTRSFSGCVPCQVVENGPFSEAEFREHFAGEVVLYANVQSRVEGRIDDDLLARFGRNVHPTMLFFDAEGNVLGEHIAMGARNVRSFRASLADAQLVVSAQREPVGDDKTRSVELLAAEIELGRLTSASALERRKQLDELTSAQSALLSGLLVRLEFEEFLAEFRKQRGKVEDLHARILTMLGENRIPTGRSASLFWMQGAMAAALGTQDRALAERALAALERDSWFENQPHDFIGEFQKRIAALPAAGAGG
jgi:hypothetical protein